VSAKSADKTPKIDVEVTEIRQITEQIRRFRFEPVSREPLPVFAGGAHVVVEMQDGETLRRNPYSLMSRPGDTDAFTISVRRDPAGRGGSLFMHDQVEVGSRLRISHPVNLFPIDRRARKHLLFAGGIGITPMLAIMAQLTESAPSRTDHISRCSERSTVGASRSTVTIWTKRSRWPRS
jgi:ferredoxin-NADP reductase